MKMYIFLANILGETDVFCAHKIAQLHEPVTKSLSVQIQEI